MNAGRRPGQGASSEPTRIAHRTRKGRAQSIVSEDVARAMLSARIRIVAARVQKGEDLGEAAVDLLLLGAQASEWADRWA